MSAPIACPRCGETDKRRCRRCWVCGTILADAGQDVGIGLGKILGISLAVAAVTAVSYVVALAAAIVMAVGLVLVTCTGGGEHIGR